MIENSGKFIISLDFELLWGVIDKKNRSEYNKNILAVNSVIPKMLKIFENHNINATFATVGFLFAENKELLIEYFPELKPNYTNKKLSPYHFIENEEVNSELLFAYDLLEQINSKKNHEIASHTFCHYYCLADGQLISDFKEDMKSAIIIAKAKGVSIKSLVFPRNQFNQEYLQVISELGLTSYRGNQKSWYYNSSKNKLIPNISYRIARLLDDYINISGHNTYTISSQIKEFPYNLPASKFLRPYSTKLKLFNSLRLNRIKRSMTYAAKNKEVYHLWWHPHNFGMFQNENFKFLKEILIHYQYLNKKFGFESITMEKLAENMLNNK